MKRQLFITAENHGVVPPVFIGLNGVFSRMQTASGQIPITTMGPAAFFAAQRPGHTPIP